MWIKWVKQPKNLWISGPILYVSILGASLGFNELQIRFHMFHIETELVSIDSEDIMQGTWCFRLHSSSSQALTPVWCQVLKAGQVYTKYTMLFSLA